MSADHTAQVAELSVGKGCRIVIIFVKIL